MNRAGDIIGNLVLTISGVLIASLVMYGFVVGASYFPVIESSIVPVISVGPVRDSDTYRDQKIACFVLHLTKLESGAPIDYRFFGDTTDPGRVYSPQLPLSTYIATAKHSKDPDAWLNHKVGEKWDRPWCFEIPETVADWQAITITGSAYHRRHWFYDSMTPIPPFVIPAMKTGSSPPSP